MVSGNLQNTALENLSEEERKVVAEILAQISTNGKSQLFDDIRYSDYKEIPVDIITFIKDNRYLGKAWHTADGKCKLFPYWEKKLKEIFPDNLTTAVNNFIESGARGLGKAQPLDSLVFTEHGYRRMGDIHVGDRVYGNDGNLHNVMRVFPQGVKPVCRVTFSDKTSTLCSDEHLWTVYDNSHGGRQRTITCKEMYETGLKTTWGDTRYKIPITKPLQFSHKETFISPYMMGVFLGDGGFGFNAASFTSYDDEIVDAVKYEIAQNDYCLMPNDHSEGCRSWYIKNNNYVVGGRTPNAYVEYAKKLNLAGKRAWEKHIPPEYLYNDVESRIALLQGLMDTDGEVDPLYQEAYTTTSKQLANDVVFLVQSLGGTAILKHYTNCTYKYKGESRPCRDSYTVNIKLPKSISAVKLNRKRIKLNPRRFEPFRMVKSIEYVEPQECQCILLDSEEHLYLTNDLIVTHNSEIAITIALYLMHRLMCLKDARTYYDIKPTEQIAFAFMNITETLSYNIGVTKFQNTVQLSPWFMERGEITGRQTKVWNPPEFIHIIVGSRPSHVIGQPVFFAFFDEISFIQNQDIEKQKEKAIDMIDTAIGGMKTRFIKRGQNPTLLCLASSKRSDKSFLEVHTRKKLESEKENVIIVDEPVWNVRPADEYCGVKFYVAQGNKYLASEIIPKGADLKPYKDRGFTIIEVPIEFYAEFYENIERALCDFAGVSSSDITKYIAGYRLQAVKKTELKNPFTKDIIEVGNGPEDKTQYYDFFDMNLVDEHMKSKPLYIHLDMSLSGDRTGIAGVWIKGKKPSAEGETPSKDLYYQLAFSIAVKAPRGFQVSFEKNRQFIYWLKEKGFRIKGVSSDTYQSADLKQQLIAKGYKYDIISVDRVETLDDGKTKLCKPYHYFRNTLYEERIEMYDSELLTTELLGLERNSAGRIDHPDSGQSGCFTGDTKVRLVDGRSLTFLELVDEFNSGKINYVYSFNHQTERIEPRKILKAWCTLRDQPLVRVILDDGSWVECTHNHKFMLRDGTYKEAKDLQPQDSLMPLYTKYPEKGLSNYRMYYEPIEGGWHYEHRRFVIAIDDGKDLVHHINCNPKDNTPDNLIYVSRQKHQLIHAELQTGAQSPEARKKRSESVKMWHMKNSGTEKYATRAEKCRLAILAKTDEEERNARIAQAEANRKLAEERKRKAELYRAEREAKIKDIERIFNVDYSTLSAKEKNSLGNKYARMKDPTIQERITKAISLNHSLGRYENAKTALAKCNAERRGKPRPESVKQKMRDTYSKKTIIVSDERRAQISEQSKNSSWYTNGVEERFIFNGNDIPEGFHKGRLNHKVASVEFLDKTADVYDITVDNNHNFALDIGVFVHNSKDVSDAVCGALWNASQNAEEFAFDYGEDIQSMVEVSSSSDSNYQKQQVMLNFQEELQKVFGAGVSAITQRSQPSNDTQKEQYKNMSYIRDGIIPF